MTWKKNGEPLKPDEAKISQTPSKVNFKIPSSKRSDAGEYELELENANGCEKVPITLKVLGMVSS